MGVLVCERLKGMIKEDEDIAIKLKIFFTSSFTTKDAGKMPNLDFCFLSNKCKVLWDIKRSCGKILNLKEIRYWAEEYIQVFWRDIHLNWLNSCEETFSH